jgi:molecular chaperone GrpE (heat shock protein)
VFTAAGVEEIAPRRNDPFLGTDHAMFQMIRRSSAVDRSGAVAQTVSRGLRQRDRIVRKATVVLFE